MSSSRTVRLHLEEGHFVPVEIRREGRGRSLHTEKPLTELHGWVETSDLETHRWLSMVLRSVGDRGAVRATTPEGEFAGKWQVSWNSYGDSAGVHTYALVLREAEELVLEALILDGLELHPYEYCEKIVGEGLTIRAKMVGTEADVHQLESIVRARSAFPVIRRGIHEAPREMRMEIAQWSQYEDRIKYRLVLVDRDLYLTGAEELVEIQEEKNRAAFGFYESFIEGLTDTLIAKGLVSPQEIDAVRQAARTSPGVVRQEFWRVTDVDLL